MGGSTLHDLTGQRFGWLVVIERAPGVPKSNGKFRTMWRCVCDCGNTTIVSASHLKNGHTTSCGCKPRPTKAPDLIGQSFGRLTVLARSGFYRGGTHREAQWLCRCDCGNEVVKTTTYLRGSNCPSCGCAKSDKTSEVKRLDLVGKRFGFLTVVKSLPSKKTSGGNPVAMNECVCDCGNKAICSTNSLICGNTKSCGCLKSSYGEALVTDSLKSRGVRFKREFTFGDLKSDKGWPLRFDFAIFESDTDKPSFLIEYQGVQHFKEVGSGLFAGFGSQQRDVTDDQKREYCRKNGFPLYEIRYDEDVCARLNEILSAHANPVPSSGNSGEGVTTIP